MRAQMLAAFSVIAAATALSGCSSTQDQAMRECQSLAEGVLTQMAADYPAGPKAEEITQVEVLTTDPLECRGRLFYDNSQVATVEYDREFYRTGEGSTS